MKPVNNVIGLVAPFLSLVASHVLERHTDGMLEPVPTNFITRAPDVGELVRRQEQTQIEVGPNTCGFTLGYGIACGDPNYACAVSNTLFGCCQGDGCLDSRNYPTTCIADCNEGANCCPPSMGGCLTLVSSVSGSTTITGHFCVVGNDGMTVTLDPTLPTTSYADLFTVTNPTPPSEMAAATPSTETSNMHRMGRV